MESERERARRRGHPKPRIAHSEVREWSFFFFHTYACIVAYQEIVALATLSSGYGGGEVLERREDDEDRPPSGQKASKGPGVKSSCPVATYGALEVTGK